MNAEETPPDAQDELSKQRALLVELITWEHELAVLKELESDLEVEEISAGAALKSSSARRDFGIGDADARDIAAARARKLELRAALERGRGDAAPTAAELRAELARTGDAREALEAWIEAPDTAAGWRRPRITNSVLAVACIAALWAAVAVHPVNLVLLLPFLMAIAYFTFTAHDADWVRLGARRRLQKTRLPAPEAWNREAVETRMGELEQAESKIATQLEALEARGEDKSEERDAPAAELDASRELVEACDALDEALARAGLDASAIDEELARWLDSVDAARRVASELAQVRSKRKSLSRQVEDARDALFRFLVRHDAAPPDGHADSQSLSAALDSLNRRPS